MLVLAPNEFNYFVCLLGNLFSILAAYLRYTRLMDPDHPRLATTSI